MKNVRRQILINPGFQIRFAFLFTATILAFCFVMASFAISGLEYLGSHATFAANEMAHSLFQSARHDLIVALGVLHALIGVVAFFIAIYLSHRIAGPLYKLRVAMISMQQGVLDQHIKFRTKDNFKELADGFNAMTDAIFIRRRKDFERVASVIPKLERLRSNLSGQDQAATQEALNALQELHREVAGK